MHLGTKVGCVCAARARVVVRAKRGRQTRRFAQPTILRSAIYCDAASVEETQTDERARELEVYAFRRR